MLVLPGRGPHGFLAVKPRNKAVLVIVVIFVGLQLWPVERLLHARHISIHFKLILNVYLLVQHFFIVLHVFFLSKIFVLQHLSIVGRLQPCLVLVKLIFIIHLVDELLFLLLHLEL